MTNKQLQSLTEKIALKYFHQVFRHQIIFNPRLKTTGGRYHLKDGHIDINPLMLTEFGENVLIGVIKHELVHYFLHQQGQNPSHRNPAFKKLLHQVGGLRFAPQTSKTKSNHNLYQYQCLRCGQIFYRKRRVNLKKMVCGKCHGRLTEK